MTNHCYSIGCVFELAETIAAVFDARTEGRRKAVLLALTEDKDLAADCPALAFVAHEADALAEQIEARVKTLRTRSTDETRKRLTTEAQELRARELLAQHKPLVLNEIERKKRIAAYELCINDTTTNAITQKSTAVTKTAVSQKLKQSFTDELTNLGFRHVEVELKEAGSAEGVLYQKLILTRALDVELPNRPLPLTGLTARCCVLEFPCPYVLRRRYGTESHQEKLRLRHYGQMKQVHDIKASDVENRGSSHLRVFEQFTRSCTTCGGWSSKGHSPFAKYRERRRAALPVHSRILCGTQHRR
jgi:hypothetical protein